MIDYHYWTTPNGHKIAIFLEESGLPYQVSQINLTKNEQFSEDFLRIAPNNKIPAIVDHDPTGGGAPISIFESGAILVYLADKIGRFIPADARGRVEVMQWLFWQVGGLGPMAGQQVFFRRGASEQIPLAIDRFTKETARLYGVLNKRLADRPFLAGEDYTIADISAYPWVAPYTLLSQEIDDYPHVERWLDTIAARPATQRAYALAKEVNPNAPQPPAPRAAQTATV
ncbi:MAG: glutathione S-transferase N-terminal domain-containing protein [Rhizobiaceae bacterium]|nr:glutathione S-transferase N-terminal domain-containing protein [Rhizobiaceae bacterium]